MKAGDTVITTTAVTGGGKVRRVVLEGEIGMVMDVHGIMNLKSMPIVWYDVIMSDGLITLPGWCLKFLGDQ